MADLAELFPALTGQLSPRAGYATRPIGRQRDRRPSPAASRSSRSRSLLDDIRQRLGRIEECLTALSTAIELLVDIHVSRPRSINPSTHSRQLELPIKFERMLANHTEQLTRVQGTAYAIDRHLGAVRRLQAADTETLSLVLRKVTQLTHDLQPQGLQPPPPRPTGKRPLG